MTSKTYNGPEYVENNIKIRLQGCIVYITGLGVFCLSAKKMGYSPFITLFSLFTDLNIFYLWHYLAHLNLSFIPYAEITYGFHKVHHYVVYPPNNHYGDEDTEEKEVGEKNYLPFMEYGSIGNFFKNAFVALFLEFIFNTIKFLVLPRKIAILTMIQSLCVYLLGTYLHQQFHKRHSWLKRFDLFNYLSYKHVLHHGADTKHNFSIMCFLIDILWGTNENGKDPKLKHKAAPEKKIKNF